MINPYAISIPTTPIRNEHTIRNNYTVYVARFDLIHPVVSGNKLFKLHRFLEKARQTGKPILTFGGAWSNHLAATAFACKSAGITCRAIVAGLHAPDTPVLRFCAEQGMQIERMEKQDYRKLKYDHTSGEYIVVPEGGYHPEGATGAGLMWQHIASLTPTHTCISVGSATTLAGILQQQKAGTVIAVPAIKNMQDIPERLHFLKTDLHTATLEIWNDFHFGGFAKTTPELIAFINQFQKEYSIPLDGVYTGKLMYAVMKKIEQHHFPAGSCIVCIHTGGLTGNAGIPGLEHRPYICPNQ